MISKDQWINLPVGYNLEDHTNVSATAVVVAYSANIFCRLIQSSNIPTLSSTTFIRRMMTRHRRTSRSILVSSSNRSEETLRLRTNTQQTSALAFSPRLLPTLDPSSLMKSPVRMAVSAPCSGPHVSSQVSVRPATVSSFGT